MNGLSKETKEELMNSIQYRECDIIYKKQMYHIEPYGQIMTIGIYDKTNKMIEKWIEIDEGNAEKSYQSF